MPGERRAERSANDRPMPAASEGRVPPHNLQAEESVLGALLLSRDAIGARQRAGAAARPTSTGRPTSTSSTPSAPCTRAAARSTRSPSPTSCAGPGCSTQVGGSEAMHELQNATPAISSAGHYAKIVQDTAMLRRLIYVAGDIAELAYSEPDDVTKALDEAETKVFQVAEQRVTDSTPPARASCSRRRWTACRRRSTAATRSPASPPATRHRRAAVRPPADRRCTSSAPARRWASAWPGTRRWSTSSPARWSTAARAHGPGRGARRPR